MSDLLIVFVKAPRPGLVKTRLAAAIGAEHAAALYRAMAERVFRETDPASGTYARVVCYAPADGRSEVDAWLPGERLHVQSAGDLGARMAAAFEWAFDGGAARVVLIGTDTPDVSRGDLLHAFEALRASDLVVGPSLDGGYYLIGLPRPIPALFERIPWSTPAVLGETLTRAESLGLRAAPLAVKADIDTLEDVRRNWAWMREWLPADLVRAIGSAASGR
jgi:rSAM/selenodomain-associated transferase 1